MDITTISNDSQREVLSIRDPKTGVDYISDLVGNADAIGADENDIDAGKFVRIDHLSDDYCAKVKAQYGINLDNFDGCDYVAVPETLAWWLRFIEAEERLHQLIAEARLFGADDDEITKALVSFENDLFEHTLEQVANMTALIDGQKQRMAAIAAESRLECERRGLVVEIENAGSIEHLCDLLNEHSALVQCENLIDEINYDDLPTFGAAPESTLGVFSWSSDYLLVQTNTWELVERVPLCEVKAAQMEAEAQAIRAQFGL